MMSKIHVKLVSPAGADNAPLPCLSLATLSSLTPAHIKTSLRDDFINPIDFNKDFNDVDLVGITCSSKTAHRAYEIAAACNSINLPVVLGGIHPSAVPEEAEQQADALIIGEAEQSWSRLLEDFRRGNLEKRYSQNTFTCLEELPKADKSMLRAKEYFPLGLVQATRGCPYNCEFCSVQNIFGRSYRYRPLEQVLQEIKQLKNKVFMFVDDNIVGHAGYSKSLFKALIPLKKRWIGQASLPFLEDENLIRLMVKSGCAGLLLGIESVSEKSLRGAGKFQNKPEKYRDIIDKLQKNGIAVWANFVFGFDGDEKDCFEQAVRLAIDCKIFTAVFAILTPYPGTELYQRLKLEGRLTKDQWWLDRDQDKQAPHFQPLQMDRQELIAGWKWAWQEFYSYSSICKRFQWQYPPTIANKMIYFPFNLVQHRFVRKRILGGERISWSKYPWSRKNKLIACGE